MLRGNGWHCGFRRFASLLGRRRFFDGMVVDKARAHRVARTILYSSLPGTRRVAPSSGQMSRQSMRGADLLKIAASLDSLKVSMDKPVVTMKGRRRARSAATSGGQDGKE
jgi:hypothetical protein